MARELFLATRLSSDWTGTADFGLDRSQLCSIIEYLANLLVSNICILYYEKDTKNIIKAKLRYCTNWFIIHSDMGTDKKAMIPYSINIRWWWYHTYRENDFQPHFHFQYHHTITKAIPKTNPLTTGTRKIAPEYITYITHWWQRTRRRPTIPDRTHLHPRTHLLTRAKHRTSSTASVHVQYIQVCASRSFHRIFQRPIRVNVVCTRTTPTKTLPSYFPFSWRENYRYGVAGRI